MCGNKISRAKYNLCRTCTFKNKAKERFDEWLITGDLGFSTPSTTIRGNFKELLLDYYGRKCNICGISEEWNNKKLTLIVDHIDGDASNNKSTNLRLVCPNCDSQLDTYKSKNKNSARKNRYKYR